MKFITFFVVLVTTSAAFPFWNDEPEGHLEARDDEQKLINPDNEDPYYEPITDSDIEKSRILSGIGPEEAKQRYFDWDESCDNEYDRKKIVATFVNFQQLVEQASEKLGKLSEGLEENESKVINKKNRQKIAKEDPAFTQMFRGFDYLVDDVKDGFDKIMANVKNSKRGTAEKPGALRFICSARDQVLNQKGTPFCGSTNQALTQGPFWYIDDDNADDDESMADDNDPDNTEDKDDKEDKDEEDKGDEEDKDEEKDIEGEKDMEAEKDPERLIEQKYAFTKSSSITFCPAFFNEEFPNLDATIGWQGTEVLTLDKVNCRERVLLHEYMHLPWVKNLNPKDDPIGYYKAARQAANFRKWEDVLAIPDSYAWYALYSYFNNVDGGCGDAWPPKEKDKKPTKNV